MELKAKRQCKQLLPFGFIKQYNDSEKDIALHYVSGYNTMQHVSETKYSPHHKWLKRPDYFSGGVLKLLSHDK